MFRPFGLCYHSFCVQCAVYLYVIKQSFGRGMLLRLRETLVSRDGDSCLLLASPPSSLRVALLPHSFVCAAIHKLTTSSVHESGSLFSATMNRETIVTPVTIVFSTVFIAPVAYVRTFAYEVVLVSSHSHVEVFSSPPIHSLALVIVSPSQCRCLVYKTSLWASSIRYVFRLVLLISLFICFVGSFVCSLL